MRKAGKSILIVGLICLLGPLFGFTYKGLSDYPGEVSQMIGIVIIIFGGLILACTKDDNNTNNSEKADDMFKCPKCGEIVVKGTERCPSCNIKFEWDDDTGNNGNNDDKCKCPKCGEIVDKDAIKCPYCGLKFNLGDENNNDDDLIVYSDEYYLKYAESIEPFSEEILRKAYITIKETGKVLKIKNTINSYSSIETRKEFLETESCVIVLIMNYVNNKKFEHAILFIKYYVKYYTKVILKYGDNDDKLYLSRCINLLKSLNNDEK